VGAGTSRIEVTPNAQGIFTFAIVHPTSNINPTTGNPLAWIDIPGGVSNRPDPSEPQARGENFAFSTGTRLTATLEVLGCPPGTDQRGWTSSTRNTGTPGNNPFPSADPCLGKDVVAADPHVPWPLQTAPESGGDGNSAATGDAGTGPVPDPTLELSPADPSRGDVVVRLTLRDPSGNRLVDNPATGTDEGEEAVTFEVSASGSGELSAAPNRPNPGSQAAPITIVGDNLGEQVVNMTTRNGVAEIVIDRNAESFSSTTPDPDFVSATISVLRGGATAPGGLFCPTSTNPDAFCTGTARWADIDFDTTVPIQAVTPGTGPEPGAASTIQCPSTVPCFNGALTSIDKARDSYVMQRGGSFGGFAYVVYAVGGGGEPYTTDTAGIVPAPRQPSGSNAQVFGGERPSRRDAAGNPTVDEYFIDGIRVDADPTDNVRCGYFSAMVQAGCARFEATMSFDDRMVYEFAGTAPTRTQTHFLTNGTAPVS